MLSDPKTVQWIASLLLVLSGVQTLVLVARAHTSFKMRLTSGLIALAATGFGVVMILGLLGVKL